MKTKTLTDFLAEIDKDFPARKALAKSFGITYINMLGYAKRGYYVAYIDDKPLLMTKGEHKTLTKWGFIND